MINLGSLEDLLHLPCRLPVESKQHSYSQRLNKVGDAKKNESNIIFAIIPTPCITLRDNTERPETCERGTNELIGTNPNNIAPAFATLLSGKWKKGGIPELWDDKAAE